MSLPLYRIVKRRPYPAESNIIGMMPGFNDRYRERFWIEKACSCIWRKKPKWTKVEIKGNHYASSFVTLEEAEYAINNLINDIDPTVVAVYSSGGKID